MLLSDIPWRRDGEWCRHHNSKFYIAKAMSPGCEAGDGGPNYQTGQYCIMDERNQRTWRRLDPLEAQAILYHVLGLGGGDAAG